MTRPEYIERAFELARRGQQIRHAKLTEESVRQIRREYRYGCRVSGAPAIAKRMGLHRRTVEKVLCGETWAHVR